MTFKKCNSKKWKRDSPKYVKESSMMEEITKIKYEDHTLILYSDLAILEYVYLNYSKNSLESLNEIILILPYYHSVADVVNILTSNGIDIGRYKKEGSIIVVESKKAYYGLTQEFVGIMIMMKMLLHRADKMRKAGITVVSDMGLFFDMNKIDDLTKYETELLSSIHNMNVKVLCGYNKSDFELLEHQRQQHLLKAHNKIIIDT